MDFNQKLSQTKLIVFDFDGVFTDNCVYVFQDGSESVSCWRSDGLGLSKIKGLGLPVWVISTEKNPVVGERCKKLGVNCIQDCDDKLSALKELTTKYGCGLEDVVYTGNDINDLRCLESVGIPIVVADSHSDVLEIASYVTKKMGGRGAVREVCDLIVTLINNKKTE